MCPHDEEIEKIKKQLVEIYHPKDIILFGSCAKERVTHKSEYDVDLDIVVYTPSEWEKYKDSTATFAGIINRTGVSLIGRQRSE